ncbi:hypothetical protein Rmar_2143 [Rhodothermus marinus DSM 4252]|uniref:Uncharacterized protein n=2 Tax=Rhodothermus marinus TaxID=29549 RepID=D0MDB0_RHOM4|nr:hypothetical protein Rmar_2143 [Rhodothermus marinus DSM 4252]
MLAGLWLLLFVPTTLRAGPAPVPDTTTQACQVTRVLYALDSPHAHLQNWGLEETLYLVERHAEALPLARLFAAVVRAYEQAVDDQRTLALAALLSFDADDARAYVHGHATESEQQDARDRWIRVLNGRL